MPFEGPIMYPGVRFIARGVGVRALTPEGYEPAWNAILPAAEHLAAQGVDAIMVIGTSLTFFKGPEAHQWLLGELRRRPACRSSTMSQAIIDGLREMGAKRVAVATAYSDVVNRRLKELLAFAGIETLALECFDLLEFGGPSKKSEADIIALSGSAVEARRRRRGYSHFLRRLAHAGRRQAAGRAPWHSGRVVGDGGILGRDAARWRERPDQRLWPAVRGSRRAGELRLWARFAGVAIRSY